MRIAVVRALALTLALVAGVSVSVHAQSGPMAFATPDAAFNAIVGAAGDFNVPKLLAILGPGGKNLVQSADAVADKKNAQAFAAEAHAAHLIQIAPSNPNKATIVVGDEAWPMPIPLVKKNGKWYFDTAAGRQEILYRRIGTNELDAIEVCRGYVEAQKEYALTIHDNSGVNQYAQRIFSTPGKHNGLYWKNSDGTDGGPIGETVAKALDEGYKIGGTGYHGYYFKILKGQGASAPLGKMNYVIQGAMIGGFGLVAVPAQYGVTGIKTFIVGSNGIVYQRDLGANSLAIVKDMTLYNPSVGWQPTSDVWPPGST
jgi:hypothetical protein